MFTPGTQFIPYKNGERHPSVTVRKSWVLYSSGLAHWFKDVRGDSAHIGYVCDGSNLATIVKKAQNVKKAQEPEDRVKELQIKFPVGTLFRAVTSTGALFHAIYTVKEDWYINNNGTGYYFSNPKTTSPHTGYLLLSSGEEAEILGNTIVETNAVIKLPMSPLEYVKANFPPGTVFIPEDGQGKEVIVKEDWELNIGSRGSIWFRDELRNSVHKGFLYLANSETYAKIVSPGKVPQLENEPAQAIITIDRPLIVSKTIPTTGPNVPVIVSIPTLLKTKRKSKLISNQ
jgi:hypothetical protein